jgi:hypothetical protein
MVNRPDSLSHLRFRLPVVRAVAVAAAAVAALLHRQLHLPVVRLLQLVRAAPVVVRLPRLSNRNLGKIHQCSILNFHPSRMKIEN